MAILRSMPGIGSTVLSTLLSEAGELIQKQDYTALRCLCGVAPITKRSRKVRIVPSTTGSATTPQQCDVPLGAGWLRSTTPSPGPSIRPSGREDTLMDAHCEPWEIASSESHVPCSEMEPCLILREQAEGHRYSQKSSPKNTRNSTPRDQNI